MHEREASGAHFIYLPDNLRFQLSPYLCDLFESDHLDQVEMFLGWLGVVLHLSLFLRFLYTPIFLLFFFPVDFMVCF